MNEVEGGRSARLAGAMIGGIVVAAVGPVVWYGMLKSIGNAWIPPLLIGAGIGLVMRVIGRSADVRLSIAASILTVVSCAGGYLWADSLLWKPFIFGESVKRMLNDLPSIALIAVGAYFAFVLARRLPAASAP
jgi:hypothetical protein